MRIVLFVLVVWCYAIGVRQVIPIGGGKTVLMHVLDPSTVPPARAATLVKFADLSTCTSTPSKQDCAGLIRPSDRVIVTNKYILWLNLEPGSLTITDGGAGFLRGIWSIGVGSDSQYNFLKYENAYAWAPNELLPGINGIRGSGVSLQLRLVTNQDIPDPLSMGAENSDNVRLTLDGNDIHDGGLYSGTGVFYQTAGSLAHFERNPAVLRSHGFDNVYDVNNQIGVVSVINFVLTYRIDPRADFVRQEMSLTVTQNPTSSIATYVMSTCGYGSAPWSASYSRSDVPRINNRGVNKPTCSAPAQFAANQWVPFDKSVISKHGLNYMENAVNYQIGSTWTIANPVGSRRALTIRPITGSGFQVPEHVQTLLNAYSSAGVGVVCVDVQYTDANQCGPNTPWQNGYSYNTAIDISTTM